MLICLNKYREAMDLLKCIEDSAALQQCAFLFKEKNQYHEAANLYEITGLKKEAALLLVQCRNLTRATEITNASCDRDVFLAIAREYEDLQKYDPAIQFFERIGTPFYWLLFPARLCAM